MRKNYHGYIPDLLDNRDLLYAAPVVQTLPSSVDLRSQCPPVYSQSQLGSCTAQAIAGAIEFDQMKQRLPSFVPSRLFIYYNEREMEGTVSSDSGAQIRDGIKSVNKLGVCPESEWPYDITQFTARPTTQCYADALLDKSVKYQRIARNLDEMRGCLASGYPFVLGFTVYESFESAEIASTGIVPMPIQGESVIGGHAVLCVGYDNSQYRFLMRNSWGESWGMQGNFTLPYDYVMSLADDFWTIKTVGA